MVTSTGHTMPATKTDNHGPPRTRNLAICRLPVSAAAIHQSAARAAGVVLQARDQMLRQTASRRARQEACESWPNPCTLLKYLWQGRPKIFLPADAISVCLFVCTLHGRRVQQPFIRRAVPGGGQLNSKVNAIHLGHDLATGVTGTIYIQHNDDTPFA